MGEGVYAIAGGKGGVGKTTTAINLGVVLGQAGYEVVVVDADLAMPDVGRQLHLDHERGLHSVLAGEAAVREVVVDGPGGLAVVPGDRDLASFADADPGGLRKVCNLLGIAYDVVLVDTAPGLQNEAVITYQEVDGVVLVTTPEPNAVEDVEKTGRLAADVGADLLGAVVTHGGGRRAREAAGELDSDLLGIVPHHSTGGPITATAPDDAAADAYRQIGAALPAVDAAAVVPDGETGAEPATADPDERGEDTGEPVDAVAATSDGDTETETGSDATARPRLTAEIPRATAAAGDDTAETDGSATEADEGDVLELVDDAVERAQDVDVDHVDDEIASAAETAAVDDRAESAELDDEPEVFDLGSDGSGS